MNRRVFLALMVLVVLVAAALRLPDLVDFPPGLHYDEAANGLLAADIGLGGERPVFIASFTGKEVFFFYFAGALMRLIGDSVFTLRLAAAIIGLLTVAATYWLGWELVRDRRVAVLAAALLAVSFWHLLFSRLGFRAISQPLFQAIAVAALFRGLRLSSMKWIGLAGIALGLTAYTYLAARIFPIPLAIALLPLLIDRNNRRLRIRQLLLFAGVAFLVLLPLLFYFITNPDAFFVRIGQVIPAGDASLSIWESYLKTLGMFFVSGDPYIRFNLPMRPLFNLILAALFIIGWLVAAFRFIRSASAGRRSAYLLIAIMPFFMLLPTALAVSEIVPSNLRAIGLLPFLYLLPAVAVFALLDPLIKAAASRLDLSNKDPSSPGGLPLRDTVAPILIFMIVITVLIAGGLTTRRDYFGDWATRADLFYAIDGDLLEVSRYLDDQALTDETIFLSALHFRHPTVAFASQNYDQIKWLPNSQALVFPAEGPTLTIFPYNSPAPTWAQAYLPLSHLSEGPPGPDSSPTYQVYEQLQPPQDPAVRVEAGFGDLVTIQGYEIGRPAENRTLPLTVHWMVERVPADNWNLFVHLEDAWGHRWSQVETFAYPSVQWAPADSVIQHVEIPLPPGLPPGSSYRLRVGFFNPESGEQLPLLDQDGRYAGQSLLIDEVRIPPFPSSDPLSQPSILLNQAVGQDLTLLGFDAPPAAIDAGAKLSFILWWQARAALELRTLRFVLRGPDGGETILLETQPVHNTYPFTEWSSPQFLIDPTDIELPATISPGDYALHMDILDEAGQKLTTVDLGPLEITDAARLFEPPQMEHLSDALFGDEIRLLGYDLKAADAQNHNLTLVWQAVTEPAGSYNVFVHLLDQNGLCCLWQQDAFPQQGTYPTDWWLPGEIILDEYTFTLPSDLPPGQYPLEIGLYLPENGRRLQVTAPTLPPNDALFLQPFNR